MFYIRLFTVLLVTTFGLYVTADTVKEVKNKDELTCGVRGGFWGFGNVNDDGNWVGLDVDYCRAIATVVLKDPNKVDFVPVTNKVRLTALENHDIDVLIRNTTWTYSRDANLKLEFVAVNYYDGQGFLGWKDNGIEKRKLSEYGSGTKICIQTDTTSLSNFIDYNKKHSLGFEVISYDSIDTATSNFLKRKCDLFSTDLTILMTFRHSNSEHSKMLTLLDDVISKEPLGLYVRDDDPLWEDLVQWTFYATVEAEEKEITSKNVDTLRKQSDDPSIRYLLGVTPGVGKPLGLDDEWFYRLIKTLGNYGEIFDRNLGNGSPLALERGINDLWTRGGLMYSPPMR